jgi:hypothetical protein
LDPEWKGERSTEVVEHKTKQTFNFVLVWVGLAPRKTKYVHKLNPKFSQTLFQNGESPNGIFSIYLPIYIRELPCGIGESIWGNIPILEFSRQPPNGHIFWNKLVTEPSPYGNGPSLGINFKIVSRNGIGSPFSDPDMETGSLKF